MCVWFSNNIDESFKSMLEGFSKLTHTLKAMPCDTRHQVTTMKILRFNDQKKKVNLLLEFYFIKTIHFYEKDENRASQMVKWYKSKIKVLQKNGDENTSELEYEVKKLLLLKVFLNSLHH
jgi:hypothetical protein